MADVVIGGFVERLTATAAAFGLFELPGDRLVLVGLQPERRAAEEVAVAQSVFAAVVELDSEPVVGPVLRTEKGTLDSSALTMRAAWNSCV